VQGTGTGNGNGKDPNWRQSRSRIGGSGYLKSTDTRTRTQREDFDLDSFEDMIRMEGLESGVEGGMASPRQVKRREEWEDDGDGKKGILFSTTLEVTRKNRNDERF